MSVTGQAPTSQESLPCVVTEETVAPWEVPTWQTLHVTSSQELSILSRQQLATKFLCQGLKGTGCHQQHRKAGDTVLGWALAAIMALVTPQLQPCEI